MNKAIDITAALEAGKLPSHQQIYQFLEYFKKDIVTQAEPSSGDNLSRQGRILADRVRDIATAYQQLGEHKNKDNVLQEALYHLSEANYSESELDASVNTDEATKDLKNIRSSLRTILQIFWQSVASESSSLFYDFSSFARLSLADAAEVVEASAAQAKESLRKIDEEVQRGERDTIGRDKERLKQEEDPKVAFQHGMDTLKDAGTSVIGGTQEGAAKASDIANRASSKLQDSFYRMCERAQEDEEYHQSLDTLFNTLNKWVTRGFDATAKSNSDSLDSLVSDPTPEQHIPKALRAIQTLLERLSHTSLSALISTLRQCTLDIREDADLRQWFDDFFAHLRKSLDEPGYTRSEASNKARKDLRQRWKQMLDADSDFGRKWKSDLEKFKKESEAFQKGLKNDEDLNRLGEAHVKLGQAIEQGLVEGSTEAETGLQAAVEKVTWFWQDITRVYAPKLINMLKDVPIPRIEFKDQESELVLENVDISSFQILPSHIYIRNITDIDIVAPASDSPASTETQIGTLTHIRAQAVQLALKDVSFFYRDKTATVAPKDYTGLVTFTLPPKGLDVDIKIRLIPASAQTTLAPVSSDAQKTSQVTPSSSMTNKPIPGRKTTISQRELHRSFHVVERVSVAIAEDVELEVKESNHQIILSMFKPIFVMRFRDALERALSSQIQNAFEFIDGLAYDISKRAQVFEDTGLGGGTAFTAAVISELGRMRREGISRNRDVNWKATGTGLVIEEQKIDLETGERKSGSVGLAVGAEPQILSGEKRGPVGTASESVSKRLKRVGGEVADEMDVDIQATPNVDTDDLKDQVMGTIEEGKKQVQSFRDAVAMKADAERKKEGWQSNAFDVQV
ncbi:hypothetical protein VNI00_006213 [Paramarasmius palmivorus]|uniref:Uncharacterized protein n=1 Tax=Paramarasmius palmivorus TaxID=297713 RepID=A0AAW0D9S6_9AGAR